ncbi:Uncharacterised protein [Bordetella pertussis]|nr:Uncharacterised protein [Bordetella pertussis]
MAIPPATPSKVPTTPISAPCTRKMRATSPGPAPSVRRMAISDCLSLTAMTSDDSRLNAATATISARIRNIMRFSVCTAANQVRLLRDQSAAMT